MSGVLINLFSGVLHLFILPFADLALLSTLAAIACVPNLILSVLILKEKFIPKYDIVAVALIMTGGLIIVLMANYEPIPYSAEKVKDLLSTTGSYGLYIFTVIIFIVAYVLDKWYRRKL